MQKWKRDDGVLDFQNINHAQCNELARAVGINRTHFGNIHPTKIPPTEI